jgi:hypothetical protein
MSLVRRRSSTGGRSLVLHDGMDQRPHDGSDACFLQTESCGHRRKSFQI